MNLNNLLVCPQCKYELIKEGENYLCLNCNKNKKLVFNIKNGIPILMLGIESDSNQNFWDSGWKNRIENTDFRFLNIAEEKYKKTIRENIRVSLIEKRPISYVSFQKNDILLNIGCGMSEAASFVALGIKNYIGLDFSFNAAEQSLINIKKFENHGIVLQANAEQMPIKTSSVDIVFSSGVLHHTTNTLTALNEVHRVLKDDGYAVIGLYNSYSPKFILAKLRGYILSLFEGKSKKWYAYTETSWASENNNDNPWTITYSKNQVIELFNEALFDIIDIHKSGFMWGDTIPWFGKYIAKINFAEKKMKPLLSKIMGSMLVTVIRKKNIIKNNL